MFYEMVGTTESDVLMVRNYLLETYNTHKCPIELMWAEEQAIEDIMTTMYLSEDEPVNYVFELEKLYDHYENLSVESKDTEFASDITIAMAVVFNVLDFVYAAHYGLN